MAILDKRTHAWRDDLADTALQGRVAAKNFVRPWPAQIRKPIVPLLRAPRGDSMQVSQALYGEKVMVFEEREGWAWVQLVEDSYVGYVPADVLTRDVEAASYRVAVPLTYAYPAPDLKSGPAVAMPLNARLRVIETVGSYSRLSGGFFVFSAHLRAEGTHETDFVVVAEKFLHVPYLWGGKSVHGLDCSGLVQLALQAAGRTCPRDSDMQERDVGVTLESNTISGLRRGDLVFWDGHVGIMTDAETLLHANGHHMLTVAEPVSEAIARIAASGKPVTSLKRVQ
ncbi:MAG: NlpC/P60 family protein [Alphaproteobacteria bacterium]|nr:NlpC/P60 family protein [Alphaproteobacteria bacterium]